MASITSRTFAAALLATTALASPALAATPAPKYLDAVDSHGVDLTTGLPFLSIEEGGIGSGPGAVRLQRIWAEGAGWVDNWSGGLFVSGGKTYVQIGGISDTFVLSGGNYVSEKAQGSTLIVVGGGNYLYTAADGTKINFYPSANNALSYSCPGAAAGSCQLPTEILRPDGLRFQLDWNTWLECLSPPPPGEPGCTNEQWHQRLYQVTSSAGYQLTVSYAANPINPDPPYWEEPPPDDWFKRTSASFTNTASPPSPLPTVTYAYPNSTTLDVTDPGGRMWRFTVDASNRLTGVRRPGSGSNNISYGYGADGTVNSATKDGVTNSYSRSVVGSTATETVTNPLSQQTVVVSDLTKGRPTSFRDALNRTTSYAYDANARLTRITQPEGNYVEYGYDARGNVLTTTNVAKAGSGLANIVTSASFDATCANVVKCNKPNSMTDAKGKVTDYTYDATHGGALTVTQPAPTTGAVRPQTRFTYTQVQGASAPALYPPVYMVTAVNACQTASSCTNGADEARVTAAYNSNLLPTSITRRNGTGTLSSVSTLTYNPRGTLNTVNGPLTGTADTTKYRWDNADQLVGVTSPDPDGAGALKMRAIRLTYRPDGQVSKQELGTVTSQTDAAWNAFAPVQAVDVTFDTNSRPTQRKLSSGATAYALTQTSYDALGRPDCSAVRMNTAVYGSLPASACSLSTQGSFGPDRISQVVYDAAGQVTQNKVAVGTTDAATERTLTYTNNGLVQTLKDGENNLTTYEYDGFDRLSKTRFPVATKGANSSSTTDYEQLLSYDANGNPGSKRLRDGTSIAFTYDNLNRVTLKNLPGTEPDVSYAYDNLNRITSASQTGNALTFGWDALSRNTSQAGPQGTASFAYDAAGRRTQLTYPGTGLFVNTDYLVTGEVQKIRENGATTGVGVLATYAYNDLGNRTSVTFGNGVVQAYSYDPVSRLASLTNDLAGTANDLTVSGIAYNPASQITSLTRSNDAYAWTGHGSGSTAYVQNGLNQQTSIGGAAATWDTKGNLTSEPQSGKTYVYSSENLLTSASGGVTLAYDPLLRLSQVAGAATTKFAYDGVNAIAEYDAGNVLQRRFVFGPGVDEPIVQYEGGGTTDRRFLSSDERGSTIALTDSSGALLGINAYDEYGKPGAANSGRFQYTGQKWIGEAGLYDYKFRMYAPQLGIFNQTDPIGYADSANLYAYVGNDPVSFADPLGLDKTKTAASMRDCTGTRLCAWQGDRGDPQQFGGPKGVSGRAVASCAPAGPSDILVCGARLSTDDPLAGLPIERNVGSLVHEASARNGQSVCVGYAYVLEGNPAFLRSPHRGAFGTLITPMSVAVIPRQWTGNLFWDRSFRSFGPNTFGWVSNGWTSLAFSGLTDVIDNRDIAPNSIAAQDIIMSRAPGQLVLEITGGEDLGSGARVFLVTDNPRGCPQGTSSYSGN